MLRVAESLSKMNFVLSFLVSQRGKPKLVYGGRTYTSEKRSKDAKTQFRRCHYVGSCKVRFHTVRGTHSDEPDPAAVETAEKSLKLKRQAIKTQENPLQVIENVYGDCTQAAKVLLGKNDSLARIANRAHRESKQPPAALPKDLASIVNHDS